jgi:antitoxin HicB
VSDIDTHADKLAARPYAFAVTQGDDGVYTVQVLELPGAISEGDTPDEALANGRDALAAVIAVMLERGQEIPEPFESRVFSGTTQLRMPPSLHARAVALARRDNVSLNRFLSAAVAHYIGYNEALVAAGEREAVAARS